MRLPQGLADGGRELSLAAEALGVGVAQGQGEGVGDVVRTGDPLELAQAVEQLKSSRKMDSEGWAAADDWLDATWDHLYPDPLVRIANAFEGNVRHPPDVLLSLEADYYFGNRAFDVFASLRGTHGSLRQCATTTFVLSNFFLPPPYQRTSRFRDDLKTRLARDPLLPPQPGR